MSDLKFDLKYGLDRFENLSFSERLEMLGNPIPAVMVKQITTTTGAMSYIEWHTAVAILNFWMRGTWSNHLDGPHYVETFPIKMTKFKEKTGGGYSPGNLYSDETMCWQREIVCKTTITCMSGSEDGYAEVSHDGVGQDSLFEMTSYGWHYNDKGVTSAESHSFKRASTKFGIALELYNSDKESPMMDSLSLSYATSIAAMTAKNMSMHLVGLGKLSQVEAGKTVAYLNKAKDLDAIGKVFQGLSARLTPETVE